MWKNKDGLINLCSQLILSDFSEGMVSTAKNNIGDFG
jgi:hypothetical protein